MNIVTIKNIGFEYHIKNVETCCKKMSDDLYNISKRMLFITKTEDTNRIRVVRTNGSEITFCPHCGTEIIITITNEKDKNETKQK